MRFTGDNRCFYWSSRFLLLCSLRSWWIINLINRKTKSFSRRANGFSWRSRSFSWRTSSFSRRNNKFNILLFIIILLGFIFRISLSCHNFPTAHPMKNFQQVLKHLLVIPQASFLLKYSFHCFIPTVLEPNPVSFFNYFLQKLITHWFNLRN